MLYLYPVYIFRKFAWEIYNIHFLFSIIHVKRKQGACVSTIGLNVTARFKWIYRCNSLNIFQPHDMYIWKTLNSIYVILKKTKKTPQNIWISKFCHCSAQNTAFVFWLFYLIFRIHVYIRLWSLYNDAAQIYPKNKRATLNMNKSI